MRIMPEISDRALDSWYGADDYFGPPYTEDDLDCLDEWEDEDEV